MILYICRHFSPSFHLNQTCKRNQKNRARFVRANQVTFEFDVISDVLSICSANAFHCLCMRVTSWISQRYGRGRSYPCLCVCVLPMTCGQISQISQIAITNHHLDPHKSLNETTRRGRILISTFAFHFLVYQRLSGRIPLVPGDTNTSNKTKSKVMSSWDRWKAERKS